MKHVFFSYLMILSALGCSDSGSIDSRQELLQYWGTQVVLPGYQEFETQAAALQTAAEGFCAEPSSARLDGLHAAWIAARQPWKEMEVFAFGPYLNEPLRLGPKVDFWPVRVGDIEDVLEDTDEINAAVLGASRKGFAVIEYLIFAETSGSGLDLLVSKADAPKADAPKEDRAAAERACQYLVSLASDLSLQATRMHEAWDPDGGNYLAELTEAGSSSSTAFPSLQRALSEVVNRMSFTVENIRLDKLGGPLGVTTGGSPQPDRAESQFSGRSLDDIRDNLRGVERLYFGEIESTESPDLTGDAGVSGNSGSTEAFQTALSLERYALDKGHSFSAPIRKALQASLTALDSIEMPLTSAVTEQPERVSEAMGHLAT
ncbi:MAG: imelysin family protein, partial [Myxococcota bacterium]